jgi:NDP-sugar pyrophosphorylase family protein
MVNVVIPMSGRGLRFSQCGYTFPKPLIDVNNKPMIQVVVDNIAIKGKYIFLVLKDHYEKYSLKYLLPLICGDNKCEIIIVDQVTEGAACTVLLASHLIDNDEPLLIANSDQWMNWDPEHFLKFMKDKNADGGIITFHSSHPKWSFAKVNDDGIITEVAEKKPISNIATCGVYYFSHGSDFVLAAESMISKNIRTNGEFYVCPVFNELINDGKKIYNYPIAEMKGLGTPEDLQKFLKEGV